MTADAVVLAAGAALAYAWLCATVAPVAFGLTNLITTRGRGRAWCVLALAGGSALLWTAIAAGLLLFGIVLAPDAGVAILLSPVTVPGLSLGVIAWGLQTVMTASLPRIGPAFELETALALLCLMRDDSPLVAYVERVYGAFLIDEPASDTFSVRFDSLRPLAAGAPARARRSGHGGVAA